MSVEEKFNTKNNELQQKIILEIEKVKSRQSKKNMLQLQTILRELKDSSDAKNMALSYPRIIIDSWDYTDQLGVELIELAELYKKI
ncbi:MAG: hypothetical protein NC412_10775 [Roseburia sp.]|nr:hypothetical protein [Roseburia sp.]MCM1279117.1 hypothetical protein [Robinsoniella sp.]